MRVYAVKGGAGRTTTAVNLAAALGQKHRGEFVLFDLSLPYNHAALVTNLVPTGCLAMSSERTRISSSTRSSALRFNTPAA